MFNFWMFFRLGIWWLPFNCLWSALLTQGLQVRIEHLAPPESKGGAIATLTAAGATLSLLSQVVAGPTSDHLGLPIGRRRPFLLAGTILALPFLFGFAWLNSFWSVVISFALMQWFINFAAAPTRALMPDIVPPERHGVASAHIGFWSLLGQVAGMVSMGILLSRDNWNKLGFDVDKTTAEVLGLRWFILSVSLSFLIAAILTSTLPDRTEPKSSISLLEVVSKAYRFSVKENSDFLWLLSSRFLLNLGFYTAIVFMRWFLADTIKVEDEAEGTMLLGLVVTFVGIPGMFIGGKLADKMSKRKLCIVSAIIAGFGGLLFVVSQNFKMLLLPAVLFGFGSGIFAVANWAWAVNLMPKGEGGKFFALWQFAFTIPQVIGPAISGKLGDFVNAAFGSGLGWRMVLLLCVLEMLLGAILIFKVREPSVKR
ncbi:MAG: MFS transporter [Armatimonadetes bacterium]|nr:MFS transporter [Armatimonadota bacterium]MDW8027799.1 MFS transporter [Armatimonadota bacterium]